MAILIAGLGLVARAGDMLVVSRPLSRVDAIISLASHEWERLPATARLAALHPGARVLLTQPPQVTPFNCHDCANRVDRLRLMGVAQQRVSVLSITGSGTHGEALAALVFAGSSGIKHLAVVTSPYHTRRALATFRTVFAGSGIDIGVAPASDDSPADPPRWWWAPYDRSYVTYEWAAIVYYAWHYGV